MTLGKRTSMKQWHEQVRHIAFRVVQHVVKKFNLPIFGHFENKICNYCQHGKACAFSFSVFCTIIIFLLNLFIHMGLLRVQSFDKFKSYIYFVDVFSKFSWICLLAEKSYVLVVSNDFKANTKFIGK